MAACPTTPPLITDAIAAYAAGRPELEAATERFVELVRELLDDAGINYLSVTGRTKSLESFAAKAERRHEGAPAPPRPARRHHRPDGGAGHHLRARRRHRRRQAARRGARRHRRPRHGSGDGAGRPLRLRQPPPARVGRREPHDPGGILLVAPAERLRADPHGAAARLGRVRARHPLQGHGARGARPRPRPPLHPRCRACSSSPTGSSRPSGCASSRRCPRSPTTPTSRAATTPAVDAQDLAKFLAGKYTDAGWSRGDHYTWVSGLLLELGITSVEQLAEVIAPVDGTDLSARMGYRYPPGAVRRLDDALLATFGERYVELPATSTAAPPSRPGCTSSGTDRTTVSIPSGRVRQDDVARVATSASATPTQRTRARRSRPWPTRTST